MAETQLIRQLNRRIGRTTRNTGAYDQLVREMLAENQLAHRDSPPVRLPPAMYGWAEKEAERWIDYLERSDFHVVGDLDELRPVRPPDEPG